jgi:large subunit ribosomal protein L21
LTKRNFWISLKKILKEGCSVFAVIKTGGKQYIVKPGDRLKVEKIKGEVGDTVEISEVLLVNKDGDLKVGKPLVEGSKVIASIVEQGKSPKIIVFKKRAKKGYKRKKGHRQYYTTIEIKEIVV